MEKLKICFIASTLDQGGAERQLYYMLSALKLLGANCYLICFTQGEHWENRIRDIGVTVKNITGSNKLKRLIAMIKFVNINEINLVQSVHFHINLYVSVISKILGIGHVGAIRSDLNRELAYFGYLGKLALYLPRNIAINSKASITNALNYKKSLEHLFYLPNFVDINTFFPLLDKEPGDKLIGIYLGSFRQPKRVDRIIALAEKCKRDNIPVEFRLYGNGSLKEKLIADACSSEVLNYNLFFMGSAEDSSAVLQTGDFLILTSDNEGTPNVVLEAMACGLPVIATDVGDVSELIKNRKNGFLIPLDDGDSMFTAVKELIADPKKKHRMGHNNRILVEQTRSTDELQNYLKELYSRMGFSL